MTVRFKGTVDDIEKEFYAQSEQGIDTMRDRKTNKLITGSLTVTEANGKVLGVVNLLKGKIHGEELFFDDNGKVKERNYWINGKPSKTPPPKLIPPPRKRILPKRNLVRPSSIVSKESSNKRKPNRIVNLFDSSFFQFKFKSKEEKAIWDSLPNWNSIHYNDEIKDIYKIHSHKLDALGNIIDENSTKGYTGLAKIVLDFFLDPGRMILHLKDGYIVKVEIFNLDGNKRVQHTYKDGKKNGQSVLDFQSKGKITTNYKDGRKEGTETEVYANGQKKREVNYKDGKIEGAYTYWYENGQKSSEVNYKDGRKEGAYTSWFKNGQKRSEINYKDGKEQGTKTFWYKNGQKSREQNTSDDILQGISTFGMNTDRNILNLVLPMDT